eukprot:197268-Hanusia_phi.AAC.1
MPFCGCSCGIPIFGTCSACHIADTAAADDDDDDDDDDDYAYDGDDDDGDYQRMMMIEIIKG